MALVSKLPTKRVDHPSETDTWFEFRPLSGSQLRNAAETRTERVLRNVRSMGGEVYQAMQGVDTAAAEAAAAQDPLNSYDRQILCRYGIVAWSYLEKPKPQTIDDLDDATEEWAARQILELSRPYTEEERRGNS